MKKYSEIFVTIDSSFVFLNIIIFAFNDEESNLIFWPKIFI